MSDDYTVPAYYNMIEIEREARAMRAKVVRDFFVSLRARLRGRAVPTNGAPA